jgi:ferredoxin-NADP reductase
MAETYNVKLLEKKEVAESTMLFRLEKPEGFTYRAGQTVKVSLENPAYTDEEGNRRTFSLVTSPDEDTLAVTTRMRDSAFKRSLRELPEGSEVTLAGPNGSFNLHQNAERPAVFLVGGIGITPFMSMIKDATHQNLPHQIYLFYSNRRPEDTAFLDELRDLAAQHDKLTLYRP